MELKVDNGDGIESWKEVTLVYSAALRQIEARMEVLNEEFQHVHQYNPIEHIKARIKTPESIVKKLKRHGYESTIDNMVKYINDIAGIRIICSFTSDIYRIAEMIRVQRDINIIAVKDYVTFPKASGYKSYHMIATVPVYLSDRTIDTKVEIQIRTVAMDFWASLEHKIHYKFEGDAPEHIRSELIECAKMVSDLDARMLSLNEEILEISKENAAEKERAAELAEAAQKEKAAAQENAEQENAEQETAPESSTETVEPKAEEPKAEEPKAEEPKAEEPKAEEPKSRRTE